LRESERECMKQHGIHLSVPFLDGAALDLLVGELNTQFAAMEDAAQVIASGQSCKQGWGFVEVIWAGDEVDSEFLEELQRDHEILDVCVYEIPAMTDEQLMLLETV
jgi:hypothetical protein